MPVWCPWSGLWEAFCLLSHDWGMRKSHHDRPSTLAASTFMTVGLVSTTQARTSTNTHIIQPSFLESTVPLADSALNNSSHSPPQQTRRFQSACGPVSKTMERVGLIEVISQAVNGKGMTEARKEKKIIPLSNRRFVNIKLQMQQSDFNAVSGHNFLNNTAFFPWSKLGNLLYSTALFWSGLWWIWSLSWENCVWDGKTLQMGGQFITENLAHTVTGSFIAKVNLL